MAPTSTESEKKPHLTYTYKDMSMVDEAMLLIIHHVRRQASTQKKDKQAMKQLMRQNVQKLFHRAPAPLSDDEDGKGITGVPTLCVSGLQFCYHRLSQFMNLH